MDRYYTLAFAAPHFNLEPNELYLVFMKLQIYPVRTMQIDNKPHHLYTRTQMEQAWEHLKGADNDQ